ncbi:MAG: L,D-transpeptidase family protein [Bradyrhizobium sp.]
MIDRSLVRALITSAALAVAGATLGGCNADQMALATKADQPVSPKLVALMKKKNMDPQAPILFRIFKEAAELEVWKQDRTGKFRLLKTFPICRWSGDLGPKVREGDRQAPEGFYSITPAQMNPRSAYYLSFNTGYPNAYDRALGHTGSELMVHGDCSSRGCYAMTDQQIAQIYALARDAFFGGQKEIQFEAFPFHMTPLNMARHRNNPNMPFWRMLKVGYDDFEVTREEPKVDFCQKHYVFDAAPAPNAKHDPVFHASAKCPPYVIPDEIAEAVRAKEQQDHVAYARLVAEGTPVAKLDTGIDGGMNEVFAAHVLGASTGLSDGGKGQGLSLAALKPAPGTIPPWVNPPHAPGSPGPNEPAVAVAARAAAPAAQVASATPSGRRRPRGVLARLTRKVGLRGATADTTATGAVPPSAHAKPKVKVAEMKHHERPLHEVSTAKTAKRAKTRLAAANRPPLKPSVSDTPTPRPAENTLVAGAQPVMQASSFQSRFSAIK